MSLNRQPTEAQCLGWLISESEDKLQRELHYSGIARQSGDSTRGGIGDVVLRESKLRRVEHIEHLPTELQATTFTEILESPAQPKIEVDVVRSPQRVTAAVAQPRFDGVVLGRISCRRRGVGRTRASVKPLVDALRRAVRQIAVLNP